MFHPPLACRLQNITSTVRLLSCRQASRALIVTTSLRLSASVLGLIVWGCRTHGVLRVCGGREPLLLHFTQNKPAPRFQGSLTAVTEDEIKVRHLGGSQDNYLINSLKHSCICFQRLCLRAEPPNRFHGCKCHLGTVWNKGCCSQMNSQTR